MAKFAKSGIPQFSVDVYQNEHLPEDTREVNAIVTVTATGGGTTGGVTPPAGVRASVASRQPDTAVVIMVDCSGSMNYPSTKMENAREATATAIDSLQDGVAFAVIGGNHLAREIYPGNGELATAGPKSRAQARSSLCGLSAGGGTAIGNWLKLAHELFGSAETSIRHGILLTDGRNEHEEPSKLQEALDLCAERFTCDARGVGTDWEVEEVTTIASALLGTADIVADPEGLAADFADLMQHAMGLGVADVHLRLWTPKDAEISFVKQVAPTVEDLTHRRSESGPRSGDYPTGSWGDESRDYHICVRVPLAEVGQEMLAARASLILPGPDGGTPDKLSQGLIRAVWTDDMTATTQINPQVAHYTGQAELAQAIQQGLDLRKSGDEQGATARLGRAVQLANASENRETAKLLAKVVDVVDAAAGTVRLKAKVADADEMTLETRSTKTVRVKK